MSKTLEALAQIKNLMTTRSGKQCSSHQKRIRDVSKQKQ